MFPSCDDIVWLEFIEVINFVWIYILLHLVYHIQFNRLPSVWAHYQDLPAHGTGVFTVRMLGSSQLRNHMTISRGLNLVYLEANKGFLRIIESIICNANHLLLLLCQKGMLYAASMLTNWLKQ